MGYTKTAAACSSYTKLSSPKKYKIQKVFIKMAIFLIYRVKVNFTPNTTIMDQNLSTYMSLS